MRFIISLIILKYYNMTDEAKYRIYEYNNGILHKVNIKSKKGLTLEEVEHVLKFRKENLTKHYKRFYKQFIIVKIIDKYNTEIVKIKTIKSDE